MAEQTPNIAAVIESPKAPISIVTRPIPEPSNKQIVVRNHAVAANPIRLEDPGVRNHGQQVSHGLGK